MPKLKRPPDRYEPFKILVLGRMKLMHVNQQNVADWFGCCRQTVNYKLKTPTLLTLGELTTLARKLDIPADEMRRAIPF